MKKIFLALFVSFILLSSFLFFPLPKAQAQTPTNTRINISIPGYTCGLAEDPAKNKCCVFDNPWKINYPDVGPLNPIVSALNFFIVKTQTQLIEPIINIYTEAIKTDLSPCYTGVVSTNTNDPDCKCINPITEQPDYLIALNNFCQKQEKPEDRLACLNCANDGGVLSGIGCIKTDIKKFIEETVFGIGIGLAGGFSLLCIIYAAFMMQSSQGNPEKLKKAQEMITSCIMGLMLIIFSVFILRLIGVNILKIPGFS